MKRLGFSLLFITILIFSADAQTSNKQFVREANVNLSNLEFSIYPNPTDHDFRVEFLLPFDQELEMYIINTSGDPIKKFLSKQVVEAGVKNYEFEFPQDAIFGIYFLVIKSDNKVIIKKIEYKAGI